MDRSAVLNVNEVENRSPTDRPPAPLTTDRLLDTLANAQRRRIVRRLFEREAPVRFERLVDDLAAAGSAREADDVEAEREAARIALHHSHSRNWSTTASSPSIARRASSSPDHSSAWSRPVSTRSNAPGSAPAEAPSPVLRTAGTNGA
jgi:hypothetical protein